MTVQDLDRLVTKTDMNPVAKRAMRDVRKAVMSGTVGNPEVGTARWSVSIDSSGGVPVKMSFSFRRD